MSTRTLALVCAAALLAAAGAVAQTGALPPEQRAGDVAFVTGGVSDDEAAAFKGAMGSYPLAIEIVQSAAGHGQYTAGATVQVTRRAGEVMLNTRADGPFVLVRLPPGQYRVDATFNGRTISKDVNVSSNGSARAVLSFAGE
jgi:hypothetical protein